MTTEAKEIIRSLLAECKIRLEETIQHQKKSLTDTKEAGSAMTSRYDTFREEAEYRTTAFGVQATKHQEAVRKLNQLLQANPKTDEKVVAGSLVTVQSESGDIKRYLLVPDGGGYKSGDILAVNMRSPVGQALMRKEQGDEVVLLSGNKRVCYSLLEVK